ncbi:tRNA(Ile)-lysidine synthase [bioreactor metagenome]|uniref:tRNA(Ile)-lysidine synthase n=1 Tax=bioreactor metagenome TaxID=1076179 RepID=A0A645GY51_9ZZZZ
MAEQVKAGKIAVAHNMNDNAETVLMNLFRGSGIEGLKGIEAFRGEIIRPLINVSRD